MRLGQNPAKMGLPAYQPKRLGMAILSYIPSQDGYFANALEILKYQIASLHCATQDFDLLVFDNGSCLEVQQELQDLESKGLIHFLFLSNYNVGKTGALNWILSALPNELIGYADGDVLFRPGWLENTLTLLETFPKAGLVTAQPIFFDVLGGKGTAGLSLADQARFKLTLECFPEKKIEQYANEVNLDPTKIQGYKNAKYPLLTDSQTGLQALMLASHMQFVMSREIARQVVPLPVTMGLNRKDTVSLDRHVDQAGYLHISALEFYIRHIGNVLDETVLSEIKQLGLDRILENASVQTGAVPHSMRPSNSPGLTFLNFLARISIVRTLFRRIYNLLFEFFAQ